MRYNLIILGMDHFKIEVEGGPIHLPDETCITRFVTPHLDGSTTICLDSLPGRIDKETHPYLDPDNGTLWVLSSKEANFLSAPYTANPRNTSVTLWTAPLLAIKATIGEP